jgi:hypothetical protein
LTETQLRNRYPTQAPVMIDAYDQKYPLEA